MCSKSSCYKRPGILEEGCFISGTILLNHYLLLDCIFATICRCEDLISDSSSMSDIQKQGPSSSTTAKPHLTHTASGSLYHRPAERDRGGTRLDPDEVAYVD